MENINNYTDVLIAGAGPAGLMMGCQLAAQNISFRIIDKKKSFPEYSGALIIHSGTMEIFDQLGLADQIIQNSSSVNSIDFYFGNYKIADFDIGGSAQGITKYPGMVMIKQSETERILSAYIEAAGHTIERGKELVSFVQNSENISSLVKLNREEEYLISRYLIGADGAHSTVRKQLNIAFEGKTLPVSLFILDCNTEINLDRGRIHFLFSKHISAGFFPFKENKWRIDGCLQNGGNVLKNSLNQVQEALSDINSLKIKNIEPLWFSNFILNRRIAKSFVQNNIFLVGDTAHVQSPAGAQGMNTGMQDSYNLAWKLAFVISGKAGPSLLESYMEERYSLARKIVIRTDMPFRLAVSNYWITRTVRLLFLPIIIIILRMFYKKSSKLRSSMFRIISGLSIKYKKSSISSGFSKERFKKNAPEPGEKLPDYLFYRNGKVNYLHSLVSFKCFTLILFTQNGSGNTVFEEFTRTNEIIKVETINYSKENEILFNVMDITSFGFYLVRPDMYIAYHSKSTNIEYFQKYLEKLQKHQ